MSGPIERFSSRVDHYVRYRPGYPAGVLALLGSECGFTPSTVVADIGSGTGKLTELLLANGNAVFAVEPNPGMREAAERLCARFPGFRSVDGTAETTGLPERCADMVTAGQSFHWFDPSKAREEFRWILRGDGFVVLVWNDRDDAASAFLRDYDRFVRDYSIDYEAVNHRRVTDGDGLRRFYRSGTLRQAELQNAVKADFPSLRGRYLSSSYALPPDHPGFVEAMRRLRSIHHAHQANGSVDMPYRTRVYYGKV